MEFFNSAVDTLQTIVVGLGGALCVWGGINLLEGYGQDNPGSKSQGVKQMVAGGGVALIGVTLVPLLSGPVSYTHLADRHHPQPGNLGIHHLAEPVAAESHLQGLSLIHI